MEARGAQPPELPPRRERILPTRIAERAVEEALVRALSSEAVERAVLRTLEGDAADELLDRALASPAVERAVIKVLDSELVDRAWEHVLDSDEVQRLIERIAESPEVRSAITAQGVGLLTDVGRAVREVADRVDAVIARVIGRPQAQGPDEPVYVGMVARAVGAVLDGAVVNLGFLAISAIFGVTIGGVIGDDQDVSGGAVALASALWSGAGAIYLGIFWGLVGQTPGMRLLSIRLARDGEPGIGAGPAIRRLAGTALSVLTLGLGFLIALWDPRRRTLADRMAGTTVVEAESLADRRRARRRLAAAAQAPGS